MDLIIGIIIGIVLILTIKLQWIIAMLFVVCIVAYYLLKNLDKKSTKIFRKRKVIFKTENDE